MKKLILLISVFFLGLTLNAKTIYITTDGNDANDGSGWDKAVKSLSVAYEKAVAGDQIWLAGGTYAITGTVNMIDRVDVYGGFEKGATNLTDRIRPDAENEPWKYASETIITAEQILADRPFDRADKNTPWTGVTIDGIVFKNIETANGRVLYLSQGVTLQNCAIINCSSTGTHVYMEREGIIRNCLFENNYRQTGKDGLCLQLRGSKKEEIGIVVENSTFRNNSCQSISIYNTTPEGRDENTIDTHIIRNCSFINNKDKSISINSHEGKGRKTEVTDCLFEGNQTTTEAGTSPDGMIITGNSDGIFTINRCIIRNNKNTVNAEADWKNSLIIMNTTTYKLTNSLIANNSSGQLLFYCLGEVYNCTIVNNEGSIYSTGPSTFMNNIIIDNEATENRKVFFFDSESSALFLSNAVNPDTEVQTSANKVEEENTIYTDISTFASPTGFKGTATTDEQATQIKNANFSLADNSVCKGKGEVEELLDFLEYFGFEDIFSEKDLAGNARFTEGKISMGAYENGNEPIVGIKTNNSGKQILIYGSNGNVVIESETEVPVSIYNIAGLNVHHSVINAGNTSIPLNTKGIYLVKAGSTTYKVYIH